MPCSASHAVNRPMLLRAIDSGVGAQSGVADMTTFCCDDPWSAANEGGLTRPDLRPEDLLESGRRGRQHVVGEGGGVGSGNAEGRSDP